MKKILSIVLALSLALSLAGCGESKPDSTVTNFCNALKTYDFEAISSYMENSNALSAPNLGDLAEEDLGSEKLMTYLKENAEKMTYSLGETQINGDTATVPVSFTYIDASGVMTAALGEYLSQAFVLAFGGAGEEQLAELFESIFTEKAASIKPDTSTVKVSFTCVKVDDGWKIADFSNTDSTVLDNILTCNIASAFDDFGNAFDDSGADNVPDNVPDNTVWHDIPLGQEIELATIKIKITGCEEKQELSGMYLNPDIAQEGTKYIVLNVAVENITKDSISFDNTLPLTDSEGRSYEAYDNAMWYYDETFLYTSLAPNIIKEGVFVYNVPVDSSDYYISILKAGTGEGYRLHAK